MRDLAIDTLGPFPPDKDGNIYICSIIDCFSRYVTLHPTSDCTAEAAAGSILKHFALFGVPDNITSDNGTQFVNKLIKELSAISGMDWKTTTPYSHEENGLSERSHKETLRHLRAVVYKRTLHRDWSMCIPIVQRIMNSTPHGVTGFAPSSIITPAIDLNGGVLFPANTSSNLTRDSAEYIKELYSR
jgi:transposase InsO family protein